MGTKLRMNDRTSVMITAFLAR